MFSNLQVMSTRRTLSAWQLTVTTSRAGARITVSTSTTKVKLNLNINQVFCVCTMSHQTYSDILCALMVGFLPFMNFLVQQSMMRQEGVDNLSQVFQILKCTHSFFKMVSRTFQKVFTVSRSDFYDLSFYNYSHSLSYLDLLT